MSCCFDVKTNLIFTGGHDGTLLAWHFETGFIKYYLHELDSTCVSESYIKDSKSVDCLLIMKQKKLLVSGTADQYIRFWDLSDLTSDHQPLHKIHVGHSPEDALTAFNCTKDNDRLVTADTSGRIKLFDLSKVDFQSHEDPNENIKNVWFIQAHKSTINSVQIVENFESDVFIVTASSDCNILLHKMSNGVRLGQFGQETFDLSA